MSTEAKTSDSSAVQTLEFYLQHSGEQEAVVGGVQDVLPGLFKRIGAGKSSLDVLGVGSGGGEVDVHMLTLLQSAFPAVPISADIVEGRSQLTDNFKALIAKTPNLKEIPFDWHSMSSEDYEKRVKAKGDVRKFDFIHMIQMLYYVDNLANSIKFFHSLLKDNGMLVIVIETANDGWDTLWKTYNKELCGDSISEYRSSAEVTACLTSQGLEYEEHDVPNTFDITECFEPTSETGQRLLNYMTAKEDFSQFATPETRAGILDLLKAKCSTEKGGRVMFKANMSCIIVHA
ncbi:histamine N-methyltransferase-like [Brachionichthys hirsutus]|uniref:histamine N-methyltransferase-like n=1 Tax=Brachionichthys hirsutus TaxID=412623 RepID=UPI003604A507